MHFRLQALEVCNGELRDLLMPLGHPVTMPEVCVHPVLSVYVKNSTEDVADTFSKSLSLTVHANTMKTVAATAMISKGSRAGHRVKLRMEKRDATDNTIVASEVIFVDLAAHVCQQAGHVARGLPRVCRCLPHARSVHRCVAVWLWLDLVEALHARRRRRVQVQKLHAHSSSVLLRLRNLLQDQILFF